MHFNKTKGQMRRWKNLVMKKETTNAENTKSGITVISLITGSKRRRKKLLRSTLTESTSEMTYLKE